ncbi:unnamed protein product [Orchesella dallaii]|uniref:Calcineurin-binding protein cabin-1 n=1 Tax=Orchesella dallaii TaxID=48710 RepID=A0ABP1REU8_9HEXA
MIAKNKMNPNSTPTCGQEYFYKLDNLLLSSCQILRDVFRKRWKLETGRGWVSTEQFGKEIDRFRKSFLASVQCKPEVYPTSVKKDSLEDWDVLKLCLMLQHISSHKNHCKAEDEAVKSMQKLAKELINNSKKSLNREEYERDLKTFRENLKAFKMDDEKINKLIKRVAVTPASAAWEVVKNLFQEAECYMNEDDFDNAITSCTKAIEVPGLIPFHQSLTFEKRSKCYLTLAQRLKTKQDPELEIVLNVGMTDAYTANEFNTSWQAHLLLSQYFKLRDNLEKALFHCQRALSINPDHPDLTQEWLACKLSIGLKVKKEDPTSAEKTTQLPKEQVLSKKSAAPSQSANQDCLSTSSSPKTPQKKGKAVSDTSSNSNVSNVDVNLNKPVNQTNSSAQLRINEATRGLRYLKQLFEQKTCFNKAEKKEIINIVYNSGTDIYETLVYPSDIFKKVKKVVTQLYERECKRKSVVGEEDMKIRFSFIILNINEASSVWNQNCMQLTKKGVEMYPDNPYFYCLLSYAYNQMNDHEEGLRHAEQALKKFPNKAEILSTRAVHLDNVLGRKEEDIERRAGAFNEYIQALPQDHWLVPEFYYIIARMYKVGGCSPDTERMKEERDKKMIAYFTRGLYAESEIHPYFRSRLHLDDKMEVKEFMLKEITGEDAKNVVATAEFKRETECVDVDLPIDTNVDAEFGVEGAIGIDSEIVCEDAKLSCDERVDVKGLWEREEEVDNETDVGDSPENVRVTAQDNKITQEETELLSTLEEPSQLPPKEVALIKESHLFPDVQTVEIHAEVEAVKVPTTSVEVQANDEPIPPVLECSVHSDFSSPVVAAVTQPESPPEPSEFTTTDDPIFTSDKDIQLPDIESSKREVTTDFEHEQKIEIESDMLYWEEIPSLDELMAIYNTMIESEIENGRLEAQPAELVRASEDTIDEAVSKCFEMLMKQWKINRTIQVVAKTCKAPPASLEVERIDEPMSLPPKSLVKVTNFPPPPPDASTAIEPISLQEPSELATIDELTVTSASETQHLSGSTDDLESEGEIKAESEASEVPATSLGTQAGDERTPLPSAHSDFSFPDALAVTQPTPPKIPKFGRNNGFTLSEDTPEYREPKVSFRTVRKASGTSKFYNVPRITETPPIIPSSTFLSSRHRHIDASSSHVASKDNYNADNEPGSPPQPETAAVCETVALSHESSAINEIYCTLTKFDLFKESQNVIAAPSVNEAVVITEAATDNELPFSQEAPSKNEPAFPLPDDLASNSAIVKCSEKQIVTEPTPSSTSLKVQTVSESEIVTGSPVLPSEGTEKATSFPSFNETLSLPLLLQQVQLQNERDTKFFVMLPLYCIAMYLFAQGYPMLAIFMILYVSFILLRDN